MKMALTIILALMVNLVLIQGRTDMGSEAALRAADSHAHLDVYASAIAKAHYNPWYCNYFKEPGYKCTSCNTAIHCYPGNFALLVQCAGRLPYCSNGYCSASKAERCIEESSKLKITSDNHKPTDEDNKTEFETPNEETETTNTEATIGQSRRLN